MSLTLTTLGQRLRQARINCGLTQEEVAAAVNMPRTALVQVESGNRNLTTIELFNLAKLYSVDIAMLLAEDEEVVATETPLVALCRVRPEFGNDGLRAEIARHLEIYQQGVELERMLGDRMRVVAPFYDLPDPHNFTEAIRQGEALAVHERKRLTLGTTPIPNVAEIISSQGIWASSSRDFPDDLSGLFMHHESMGMAILVNGRHKRGRRRFSYAHEYAHALVDRRRSGPAIATSRANAQELVEKRANAFAGEFLLPASGVEEVLTRFDKGGSSRESFWLWDATLQAGEDIEKRNKPGSQIITYQDVAYLAHEFAVSYEMAVYRLSDIGVITRSQISQLLADRSAGTDWMDFLEQFDPREPEGEQAYFTQQIGLMAMEAFRRGVLDTEQLLGICRKLGINTDRMPQLLSNIPSLAG